QLGTHPRRRRDYISVHDSWAGVLGSYYLHTNDTVDRLVGWIRDRESTDVALNLRVLDGRT
ncbi:hypothetical protein C6A85_36740, partial [Mycobacterium sp. ITM-2017-0098]